MQRKGAGENINVSIEGRLYFLTKDLDQMGSSIKVRSISKSLTISLVMTIAVISLSFIALNHYLLSEREKSWLQNKADENIDTISKTLEVPLWDLDRENIRTICTYYYHYDLITMVRLTGVSGETLYENVKGIKAEEKDLVERSREIFYDGELIGNVQIKMTPKRSQAFNRQFLMASTIGLLISVFGLIVSTGFLLRRYLRRPMSYLSTIVDSYSRGEYHPPLQDTQYSEFEPLVKVFFEMGEKIESQMAELRQAEKALKRHSDELEKMVAQRTQELETTNKSLKKEIGEREHTEEALIEREERLQAILAASPDPMVMYDTDGTPQFLNPAFTKIFGWTLEELEGHHIPFVPEDQKAATQEEIRYLYSSGATKRFESQRYTKHSRKLDVMVSAAIIKGSDGAPTGMIVNLTDITQYKALQTQYKQAQSMKAIGTLAGGIAHDFNNLLMGIQGRTSLIKVDMKASHPCSEHIQAIDQYVQSASDLTKQLLGFARGGKYEVNTFDLNELTVTNAQMFGRTRKDIQIHANTQASPLVAEIDKRQIEQVFLNLFVNAFEAMPDGGELYLDTSLISLDETVCKPHQIEPGDYAKISISDTGIGMDETTQKRIFEPFFTTKDKRRGTGLGLASAYGIVKNHGGMITVNSKIDHGSTFNIFLPVTDKEVYREPVIDEVLVAGSETVLLVDDEEMIREVAGSMLKRLGYRVEIAASGEKAIDIVVKMGDSIHLVVLDLIMPGMDGGKVFDRIREIQPQMPVILSSGYAINGQATEIMNRGCNGFIQKPFNISALSQKIRMILDDAK